MVALNLGKSADAIKDLESAIARKPSASNYYHLALAYLKAQNPKDAKEAMEKARDLKLSEKDLHPLEWSEYREVLATIERK
jgi:tetratricopeptide (TPR) repeat protein